MSDLVTSLKRAIIDILDDLEEVALILASRVAPWAAPLGIAITVYKALIERLSFDKYAAGAMAATVELTGIVSIHLAIKCWQWNLNRRKTDPEAPTVLAFGMTVLYFIGAFFLSFVLKVQPEMSSGAPIIFLLLAVVAYVSLGLNFQLTRWQRDIVSEKSERDVRRELRQTIGEMSGNLDTMSAAVQERDVRIAQLDTDRTRMSEQLAAMSADREKMSVQMSAIIADNDRLQSENDRLQALGLRQNVRKTDTLDQANGARAAAKDDRREEIADILISQGGDIPTEQRRELAGQFGVSERTIKGDILDLRKELNGHLKH